MTHRYLPWVRRGLAASIGTPDDLGQPAHPTEALNERAQFPVRVTFNDTDVDTSLLLHGPGDVIGVDTRGIVRSDPERYISDFDPNNMASIEFDQPDFPWMFTPASANGQGQLRPWLVLAVVENRAGVTIGVQPEALLPVLQITTPTSAADELPDLEESWAWAHAQVITENNDINEITDEVVNGHDLNVSRLICPRRLKANRRYFACLVPAFEAGRLAGLGQTVPSGVGLTPAWDAGTANGPIRLPVYYHWEFGTSNGGSGFEELADRLEPHVLRANAGSRPMYVGEPGEGIDLLPPEEAVLGLEGALRPVVAGANPPAIDDVSPQLREDLRQRLNAPSDQLEGVDSNGATLQPIAPPIYGSYHTATHEVGAQAGPRWMDELNLDPRLRAVAALGVAVVQENQEDLMDAAWAQVGDVIAANQLLNQAALAKAAAASAHKRHLAPLTGERLFSVTGPAHARTALNARTTVKSQHDQSVLPAAVTDPAFRRISSSQNRVLKRAARRVSAATEAGATEGAGQNPQAGIVAGIDDGTLTLDDLSTVPDGIGRTEVLGLIDHTGPGPTNPVDMSPIGGTGVVPGSLVAIAAKELANLSPDGEPDPPLVPRTDIAQSGLITEDLMTSAAQMLGGDKGFLLSRIGEAIAGLRPGSDTTGMQFVRGPDGSVIPELIGGGTDPRPPGGSPRPTGGTDDDKNRTGATESSSGPGVLALPPPDQTVDSVREFGRALEQFTAAFEPDLDEPPPGPYGLDGRRQPVLDANDPNVVAVRRAESQVDRAQWPRDKPLDPIMVGPEFPTPLHTVLADKSADHFLPGIGEIPPNSVVLAETNSRFIEAFMVGINHEMNHELQWREYPTDRRGTPFQQFWTPAADGPDIPPIHTWNDASGLGQNLIGGTVGSVVLLIRSELLLHYPNTGIYAAPALNDGTLDTDATPVRPIMQNRLDPDMTFVMLPLTRTDMLSGSGYFVVFQEQATELRFGLDSPNPTGPTLGSLPSWNDLTWGHAAVESGRHLVIEGSPINAQAAIGNVDFGENSAHMAAITLQRPVMVAFHADDMIGGF